MNKSIKKDSIVEDYLRVVEENKKLKKQNEDAFLVASATLILSAETITTDRSKEMKEMLAYAKESTELRSMQYIISHLGISMDGPPLENFFDLILEESSRIANKNQ
tara:strand:+ start:50477 stop:50794 length:318 start_codon:yes stop_codon:yes gene_type:complete